MPWLGKKTNRDKVIAALTGNDLSELLLTQPTPKPEPELADRRRHPKPGSPEWRDRYQRTKDLFEAMVNVNPSTDQGVLLAMWQLTDAFERDLNRHGF